MKYMLQLLVGQKYGGAHGVCMRSLLQNSLDVKAPKEFLASFGRSVSHKRGGLFAAQSELSLL